MKKILLVYAFPPTTKLIAQLLSKEGYDVLVANTQSQVFETFKSGSFDLVIVGSQIYDLETFNNTIMGDYLIETLLRIKKFSYARMAMEPRVMKKHRGKFVHHLAEENSELVEKIKKYV